MRTFFSKFFLLVPAALFLLSSCSSDDSFNYAGTDVQIDNVFIDTIGINMDSTMTSFRLTMASSGIERDTFPNTLMGEGSAIVLDLVSRANELKQGDYIIDVTNSGEEATGTGEVYFGYEIGTGAVADDTFTSGTIYINDKFGSNWGIEIDALTATGERFEASWTGKLDKYEEQDEE